MSNIEIVVDRVPSPAAIVLTDKQTREKSRLVLMVSIDFHLSQAGLGLSSEKQLNALLASAAINANFFFFFFFSSKYGSPFPFYKIFPSICFLISDISKSTPLFASYS